MDFTELTWRERGRLWLRLGIRALIIAAAVFIIVFLVPPLLSLFMPFVLAFLLAWMLNPLVKALQKKLGASRSLISLVVILLLFAVAGGAIGIVSSAIVTEVSSFLNNWQSLWLEFQGALTSVSQTLASLLAHLPDELGSEAIDLLGQFTGWLQTTAPRFLTSVATGAGSFAMSIPTWAVAAIAFIMGSYFLTADYPRLRFLAAERVPPEFRGFWSRVKAIALGAFGGYLKAEFIIAVVVFFIVLIGFIIIGQSYALLLALFLGILDFIPIVGAGTILVPWAVISVITGDVRHAIELMVIWGIIVVFRRVAEPKIVGNETGLSPILSLVSIYIGMRLAGVAGMILGPVLCMVAINLTKDGLFAGLIADVRLAVRDIAALLKGRPDGTVEKEE